ncbi:hypothetical protein N7488_001054 [Penicillium malachiteum]|nr:hypothetical protein N7488_001054 [Penicillium malachiteum]
MAFLKFLWLKVPRDCRADGGCFSFSLLRKVLGQISLVPFQNADNICLLLVLGQDLANLLL